MVKLTGFLPLATTKQSDDVCWICKIQYVIKNLGINFTNLIAVLYILVFVGCAPKLEEYQNGIITKPIIIGIRNLTVVEVIPDNHMVKIDWKGFNTLSGNAIKVGYEEVLMSNLLTTYLVTDKGCGNNKLSVNGVGYSFDANRQHLVIHFGDGIIVADGANHSNARHVYDKKPLSTQ